MLWHVTRNLIHLLKSMELDEYLKISIMPIAAYSRDHFLIKDTDTDKAKQIFEDLGILCQYSKE